MKLLKVGLISILLAFTLSACASSGSKAIANETKSSVAQKISKGSSKEVVMSHFGDPGDISYTDSGNEIWKYEYIDAKSKPENFIPVVNMINSGVVGKKHLLVVYFGNNEKVRKYSYGIYDYEANHGLIGK